MLAVIAVEDVREEVTFNEPVIPKLPVIWAEPEWGKPPPLLFYA